LGVDGSLRVWRLWKPGATGSGKLEPLINIAKEILGSTQEQEAAR
jgi:hypothetical protein